MTTKEEFLKSFKELFEKDFYYGTEWNNFQETTKNNNGF